MIKETIKLDFVCLFVMTLIQQKIIFFLISVGINLLSSTTNIQKHNKIRVGTTSSLRFSDNHFDEIYVMHPKVYFSWGDNKKSQN